MQDSAMARDDDPPHCPECRARLPAGLSCFDLFGAVLAWEAHDEELRREHFLLVASYNLQHPSRFTPDALAAIRQGLVDVLAGQATTHDLRRRMNQRFNGPVRVVTREGERAVVPRSWPVTVADVYAEDEPAGAAARVREWAQTVARDLAADS